MRIGVYGGTFNPVHYGHLRTALEVGEHFNLDQLRMIPCHLPAHRPAPDVAGDMRMAMLQLALVDTPGLQADGRELDRGGASYMVETLQSLLEEHPGATLLLFVGLDAFAGLESWYQWQRLFEFAHVVVMTRPACELPALSEFFRLRCCEDKRQLLKSRAGQLYFQSVTALDISATLIRELIAAGRNPQFLLPDAVIRYIRLHHLYFAST